MRARTFDDVLLKPKYSEVMPSAIDLTTWICGYKLAVPIISSPMDTITEQVMAIALAQQGGLGVVHRNMTIENQVGIVANVKRFESVIITNPVTLHSNDTVEDAKSLMEKYDISGILIVDKAYKLVGILTHRDVRFVKNQMMPIVNAMTTDLITAQPDIKPLEARNVLYHKKIEKLPLVHTDGTLAGLITAKDLQRKEECPFETVDSEGRLVVAAAVGVGESAKNRARKLIDAGVDILLVDAAHGHSKNVINMVEFLSTANIKVMAGNVATAEGAAALIDAGAQALRVGVGAASICTTRIVAGVGVPQLTAIEECAKVSNVPIIADGGLRYSGDIVKALAAGASCVMLGRMLAGLRETPGEIIMQGGHPYKIYRGMGSVAAMSQFSRDRYGRETSDSGKTVPEGVEGRVPYRGSLSNFLYQTIGGIRAGMGYIGAGTIKDLWANAEFVEISPAGLNESHPHTISFMEEAPNYVK